MYTDKQRGKYYRRGRSGSAGPSVAVSTPGTSRLGKTGLSVYSEAYLQAHGSPFTDSTELLVDPRIPDPDYTGASVVCQYDADFTYNVPVGQACFLTTTKPHFFGGVDVLCSVDVQHPSTIFRNDQLGVTSDGSLAEASITDINGAEGIRSWNEWLAATVQALQVPVLDDYENYQQWETASWRSRSIGAAIKAHDIGAVQEQSGLIQGTHLRPEALLRLFLQMSRAEGTDAAAREKLRYFLTAGPMSLFARGDQKKSRVGTSVNNTFLDNNAIMSNDSFRDVSITTADTNSHFNYITAQQEIISTFEQFSTRNREEGEEFLTSDGISMRGHTFSAARPFTETTKHAWFVGNDSTLFDFDSIQTATGTSVEATVLACNAVADAGLRQEGLSRADVAQWLSAFSFLYCKDANPNKNRCMWVQYVSTTAFTSNITPMKGGYMWAVAAWEGAGAIDPSHAMQKRLTSFSLHLCDCYGIPLAMRWDQDDFMKYAPTQDVPYMFFHIDAVKANRPFKIYRASYEEMEADPSFIVPGKYSPTDTHFEEVSRIAAGFPAITKGFTFFSTLAAGIKSAIGFVLKNKDAISTIGSGVLSLVKK